MGGQRREEDSDINLLPVMNLFVVLIPFLLMGVSFMQLSSLGASTPVHAEASEDDEVPPPVVTVQVAADRYDISVEPGREAVAEGAQLWWSIERTEPTASIGQLSTLLGQIKGQYPSAQSLVVAPSRKSAYADVIDVMSTARSTFTHITVTTLRRAP